MSVAVVIGALLGNLASARDNSGRSS